MQNVDISSTRAFDESPIRPLHIKAAVGGVGGQFCDGYVLGIIGIAISLATTPLGLDALWLGLLGGAASCTFLLPVVMERFGTSAAIGTCVAALVIGALVCLLWAPETNPRYLR